MLIDSNSIKELYNGASPKEFHPRVQIMSITVETPLIHLCISDGSDEIHGIYSGKKFKEAFLSNTITIFHIIELTDYCLLAKNDGFILSISDFDSRYNPNRKIFDPVDRKSPITVKKIENIPAVSPSPQQDMALKLKVLEKSKIKICNGGSNFFKIIAKNSEDEHVEVQFFAAKAEFYEPRIIIGGVYEIINGTTIEPNPKYQKASTKAVIRVNAKTEIRELIEENPNSSAKNNKEVPAMAENIVQMPRELEISLEEVKKPVSEPQFGILSQPSVSIDHLINPNSIHSAPQQREIIDLITIQQLEALISNQEPNYQQQCKILCTIGLIKNPDIWYKGCANKGCKKKVFQNVDHSFTCLKCQTVSNQYENRYLFSLPLYDCTGSTDVRIFDHLAHTLLEISANDFEREKRKNQDSPNKILGRIYGRQIIAVVQITNSPEWGAQAVLVGIRQAEGALNTLLEDIRFIAETII
jgi:hypothetical protein